MKNKAILILILLLAGSCFISNAAFAAWTQPKGHAYNQLTWGYYETKKKFTTLKYQGVGSSRILAGTGGGVNRLETAKFTSTSFTYYGEYGIIDSLTVFTAIPAWKWSYSDDTVKYSRERGPSGVGDIDLGLRYNLFKNLFGSGVLMSVQGTVKIPEAYDYGYPLTHLSLGDGQYDGTLALLFGRGIGKGYVVLNAGYKYRFENNEYDPFNFKPSDQIKVVIFGGYSIIPKLQLRGIIDWTKSVGNASVSQELIVDNYKYGGLARSQDNVLIRDSLGLEPDALNLGISLAYNITKECWPKCLQVVLSYNEDVDGIDIFESKDYALGKTVSLALVYMF
ncbi:MAG: hypothetical protein Q8N09_12485 [Thermodesulfovibrionia bacterium]|nr:hypothetical protein [Thermodesulfovibrionia bacterium]